MFMHFEGQLDENIVYKMVDGQYHFCCYSISVDKDELNDHLEYSICYNEGKVGEIAEVDYWKDEDPNKALHWLKELIKPYAIKQINTTKLELRISLAEILKKLSFQRAVELYDHIKCTIEFVSKNSGIGIRNFDALSFLDFYDGCEYRSVITVANRQDFEKLFLENITPCGIKPEEVFIKDYTPIDNQ